jgi:hypothetical protein
VKHLLIAPLIGIATIVNCQNLKIDKLSNYNLCGDSKFLVYFSDIQLATSYQAELSIADWLDFPVTPQVLGVGASSPMQLILPDRLKAGNYKIRLLASDNRYSDSIAFTVCKYTPLNISPSATVAEVSMWNDNVVWIQTPTNPDSIALSNDYEIMYYDGETTHQLTKNRVHDLQPVIESNIISWVREKGIGNTDLFYYDGTQTKQITNTPTMEYVPQLSGQTVVWSGVIDSKYEIFSFDGVSTTRITNDNFDDLGPTIFHGRIVWSKFDGNDYEIYLYEDGIIKQITNNTYDEGAAAISDELIAWVGFDGNDDEIFIYQNNTVTQITNNTIDDQYLKVSYDNVLWQTSFSSSPTNVYLYSNGAIKNISALSGYDSRDAQLYKNRAVFYCYTNDTYNQEVYFYNGHSIIQLSNKAGDDQVPLISGNYIAWKRDIGGGLYLIQIDAPCARIANPGDIEEVTTFLDDSYQTVFTIDPLTGASQYIWSLNPDNAGSVNADENVLTVVWNKDFSAEVSVLVRARNDCSVSETITKTFQVPTIAALTGELENPAIRIYPNPSNGVVHIDVLNYSKKKHNLSYEIIRADGIVIISDWIDDKTIHLALPEQGLYLCRVKGGDVNCIKKFIVH